MDLFVQLFEHLPELHVIICQPCATAIPPAQVSTHLKERHPKVAVATRKSLAAIVYALPDLAWRPGDVRVPKPAKEPIAGLKSQGDGLVCWVEKSSCHEAILSRSYLVTKPSPSHHGKLT